MIRLILDYLIMCPIQRRALWERRQALAYSRQAKRLGL